MTLQEQELRDLQAEWSQEYKVRRQMLIERAKVRIPSAFWHQESLSPCWQLWMLCQPPGGRAQLMRMLICRDCPLVAGMAATSASTACCALQMTKGVGQFCSCSYMPDLLPS